MMHLGDYWSGQPRWRLCDNFRPPLRPCFLVVSEGQTFPVRTGIDTKGIDPKLVVWKALKEKGSSISMLVTDLLILQQIDLSGVS